MRPIPAATFAAVLPLASAGAVLAQTAESFVAKAPIVRIAVHDLPGLREAIAANPLGRLLALPEVASAVAIGLHNDAAPVAKWTRLAESLLRIDPVGCDFDTRVELALRQIGWADAHTFVASVSRVAAAEAENAEDASGLPQFGQSFVVVPTPAARDRAAARLAQLEVDLRRHVPRGSKLAADQTAFGGPALRLEPGGEVDEVDLHFGISAEPSWLITRPGLIVVGKGAPDAAGEFAPRRAEPPRVEFSVDIRGYFRTLGPYAIFAMRGAESEDPAQAFLAATGFDKVGLLRVSFTPHAEGLREDVALELTGRPGGMLGALLQGMAPLPPQPLPEGALLQLRGGVDVEALARSVDVLLEQAELDTLSQLDLIGDLRRAWTGGFALAIGRPAKGAVVPRLYASFGIVDETALQRLLARLRAHPGLEVKERDVDGVPCVQLVLPDLPQGLQPAYALVDGTVHFAESFASLRALLQAKRDGAPPALDVGDAPRAEGPGAPLPGFDLRYDNAAIYAALREVWLPLADTVAIVDDVKALVPLDEMPEAESLSGHLGRGRAVLRVQPDRLTLSMLGACGGPDGHAFAAAYPALLSTWFTQSWRWSTDNLHSKLTQVHLRLVHKALKAYEKRTGAAATSLADLVGSPELPDGSVLQLAGDEAAEPVLRDGTEVARSSFRYYPQGLDVTPEGETIKARLIAVKASGWWRALLDMDGNVHSGWGEFAEQTLDAIEKAAKDTKKDG